MATPIVIADFTDTTLAGSGIFDVMMRAMKTHLVEEYDKGRIKGQDYATVYLSAVQSVMDKALAFTLQQAKVSLELNLLEAQVLQATATTTKINAEKLLVDQQAALATAQKLGVDSQTAVTDQQKLNLVAEGLKIPKEGLLLDQELINLTSTNLAIIAEECKLKAEFDVLVLQKDKVTAETGVLNQRKITETAQTNGATVSADSVLGKQIVLYGAQSDGFARDAEQKASKLMIDTFNVRRTTDEATVADDTNGLYDVNIGRAVTKLLAGINA